MYRREAGGCLPFSSSLWYKSFWNPPYPSMYHAVEPLLYSDHSVHRLVVFVCWFVSKLLSHDPGVCAPPLLLILIQSPCKPRCSTLTFDLHSSPYFLSGEALAVWRLLDLSCHAVPFRGNILAWNSLVCLDVGFFICRFSSMRFHLDQKRRNSASRIFLTTSSCYMHLSACSNNSCVNIAMGNVRSLPACVFGKIKRALAVDCGKCQAFL